MLLPPAMPPYALEASHPLQEEITNFAPDPELSWC